MTDKTTPAARPFLSESEVEHLAKLVKLEDIGTMRMLKLVPIFASLLAERAVLRSALSGAGAREEGT